MQTISDSLSGVAHGSVLRDVDRNIVESSWSTDSGGRVVYFVLVRYSEAQIAEVRRLSRGAKVTAMVITSEIPGVSGVRIRASEAHGVAVTLSSADVQVIQKNRFAKAISFFVWKVPQRSERSVSVAVGPVTVCGSTADFTLDVRRSGLGVSDYLLGAQVAYFVRIRGQDEVGRVVEAKMRF